MDTTILTKEQRLEYNNISIQYFPSSHQYKTPSLNIHVSMNDFSLTYNEKCLIYNTYIVEPYNAMLDDYYDHLTPHFIIDKTFINITFSDVLPSISEYITLVEMFKDLLETIDDVDITYHKTIINIVNLP